MAQKPAHPVLQRLQMLHSTRARLTRYRQSLEYALKEYRMVLSSSDPIIIIQLTLVKEVAKKIKVLDDQIKQCNAKADQSVNQNFKLLTSIKGIGDVIATATMVKTKNFTAFKN